MKIVSEPTLDRYRTSGFCEWCHRYCRRREPHHLVCRGAGGGKRLDVDVNLIAVGSTRNFDCPCHDDIQNGRVDAASVLAVVATREGVGQDSITAVVNLLLRLDKSASRARVEYEMRRAEFNKEAKTLLWRSLGVRS